MKDIIDILLYNSFIEQSGSKQTFGENQRLFKLLLACQAGRRKHATQCVASWNLKEFKEKLKENSVTVPNCTTRKTFFYFDLE